MKPVMSDDENKPPKKTPRLTLLQYVVYLGVTPCALAALALLVFIIVKRPGHEVSNPHVVNDTVALADTAD